MSRPAVAVVGAGYMGALHAEKLAALDREGELRFAGVCDTDTERAAAVAARTGTRAIESLDGVVDAADAACVAVPTMSHASVADRLLASGLDVLLEKPIATTRDEARALVETAEKGGRILQVGHIERFSPAFRAIAPVVDRPRFIEAHRIGPFPGRATDVSVVLDLMIHDLDLVSELAGADVDRVEGVGVPVLSQTEDIANARVRFQNGCILNITASRVSLEPLRKIRLFQSDAYIAIDFGEQKITVARREGLPVPGKFPNISSEVLSFDASDSLLAQDRAFVRAVASRAPAEVSGADGLRALDLALRIQESLPPFDEVAG